MEKPVNRPRLNADTAFAQPNQSLLEIVYVGDIDVALLPSPALRVAFPKLYGWTGDEDGVRHVIMDEANVGFAEAKFMIVACSAFVRLPTREAQRGRNTILVSSSLQCGYRLARVHRSARRYG